MPQLIKTGFLVSLSFHNLFVFENIRYKAIIHIFLYYFFLQRKEFFLQARKLIILCPDIEEKTIGVKDTKKKQITIRCKKERKPGNKEN